MPVAGQRSCACPKKRWIDIAPADARANGLRKEDALELTVQSGNDQPGKMIPNRDKS